MSQGKTGFQLPALHRASLPGFSLHARSWRPTRLGAAFACQPHLSAVIVLAGGGGSPKFSPASFKYSPGSARKKKKSPNPTQTQPNRTDLGFELPVKGALCSASRGWVSEPHLMGAFIVTLKNKAPQTAPLFSLTCPIVPFPLVLLYQNKQARTARRFGLLSEGLWHRSDGR